MLNLIGVFEYDYALLEKIVKDKNVYFSVKCDMIDQFCQYYNNFDSSKLDKYL